MREWIAQMCSLALHDSGPIVFLFLIWWMLLDW